MSQAPNRTAVFALIVSAASAAFTAGSYLAADAALKQERDALLVGQRVEACAVLARIADEAIANGYDSESWLNSDGLMHEGSSEARSAMLDSLTDLDNAAVLTFLGPQPLAEAQDNLRRAIRDAAVEMRLREATPQSTTAKMDAAERARVAFQQACVAAVGRFRG